MNKLDITNYKNENYKKEIFFILFHRAKTFIYKGLQENNLLKTLINKAFSGTKILVLDPLFLFQHPFFPLQTSLSPTASRYARCTEQNRQTRTGSHAPRMPSLFSVDQSRTAAVRRPFLGTDGVSRPAPHLPKARKMREHLHVLSHLFNASSCCSQHSTV